MIKKLVFSICAVIIVIVFLELVLNLIAVTFPAIDCKFLNRYCRIGQPIHDDKLQVRPNPNHPEHDVNGFRNRMLPTMTDIVALGDSNTYGYFVALDETWTKQLEKLSGMKTYNMAYGGYGPIHHLILYEEAKTLKPKLIIQAMFSGNDLWDSYNMVYDGRQVQELKSTDPVILENLTNIQKPNPIPKKIEYKNAFSLQKILNKFLKNVRNSKLKGLLRTFVIFFKERIKHVFESLGIPLKFWHSYTWNSLKKKASKNETYLILETDNLRTVLNPKLRLWALDLGELRVAEGLRISLEAIKKVHDHAAHDKIGYIVLLIPTKELAYKDIVGQEVPNIPQVYQDAINNEELVWKKTKEFFKNYRIHFIDTLPIMRDSLRNGQDPYHKEPDGHISAIGYRAIAEYINSQLNLGIGNQYDFLSN